MQKHYTITKQEASKGFLEGWIIKGPGISGHLFRSERASAELLVLLMQSAYEAGIKEGTYLACGE